MLTRILHNSPTLCTFIEQLNLSLSQPQVPPVLNLADALLVCDAQKTIAELRRQFVESVDASNMADTLRIAPWSAADVRQPLGVCLVREALNRARVPGTRDSICIRLDDSVADQHKHTRHLEGVDWHYDHLESTPRQPRYVNGLAYLDCNLWIGGQTITFDVRPYLREQTVRRINRRRAPDERLHFRSKLLYLRVVKSDPC